MNRTVDVVTSMLSSAAELGRGAFASPKGARPEQPLVLYEFEACPFCRRVREAVTALDLDVVFKPCPKGGERFRPELVERGGKAQFPYLVDPNTSRELYESADIVAYLFATYGSGGVPVLYSGLLAVPTGIFAGVFRPGLGVRAKPSRAPAERLHLWGMEASPYTRIVREALCELELEYQLHPTPVKGPRWREVRKRGGQAMVPFLVDPNTGKELYESADIRDYLFAEYGA